MKKISLRKGAFGLALLAALAAAVLVLSGKLGHFESIFKKTGKIRSRIEQVVRYFPFSKENSLKEWEEKILKGKVIYGIEKGGQLSYVRAKSEKTASALYYKISMDSEKRPVISWKWRVDKFPVRTLPETLEGKSEEDFAARVYIIFPAAFFTNSKCIEYIWAEKLPKGTSGRSGYSKNIKIFVLESGKAEGWHSEKRNICEDYLKLFGEKPRLDVGAISFMTDADSTKTSADAVYDEIEIGYEG